VGYKVNLNQRTLITVTLFLFGLLIIGAFNLYAGLNLLNPQIQIQGQENDDLKTTNNINTIESNSTANVSGIKSEDINNHFTISCSDFKKLYEAIHALNIGKEVSEGRINQSTLDGVESIFNMYAGKCPQLDEFEFE
jgi:cell division protein FtsX